MVCAIRTPKGPSHPGHLPVRLYMIIQLLQRAFVAPALYDCCDFFAGRMAVSKAYVARGFRACALDMCIDPNDDTRSMEFDFCFHACIRMRIQYGYCRRE